MPLTKMADHRREVEPPLLELKRFLPELIRVVLTIHRLPRHYFQHTLELFAREVPGSADCVRQLNKGYSAISDAVQKFSKQLEDLSLGVFLQPDSRKGFARFRQDCSPGLPVPERPVLRSMAEHPGDDHQVVNRDNLVKEVLVDAAPLDDRVLECQPLTFVH